MSSTTIIRDVIHVAPVLAIIVAFAAPVRAPAQEKEKKEAEKPAAADQVSTAEKGEPGRTIRGHTETVYQVAFSPDGALLATASFDGSIKLWRVADGAEAGTLTGHTGKVLSIAFSHDGASILSGGEDKTLKLWNVPSGGPGKLAGHSGPVRALALSPDGGVLATAGDDKVVRVWSRAAGKEELKIEGPAPVLCLAVSADGTRLLGGSADGSVRVWALTPPPPPPAPAGSAAELVKAGDGWRYLKGKAAPPADWTKPGFDHGKWEQGEGGFGFSADAAELSAVKTKLEDMAGGYLSIYLRKSFQLEDPARVKKLTLKVTVDDGFVAYLNGQEVARANVEGSPPGHDAAAATSTEPSETVVDLAAHAKKLVAGRNVLAIQGHNSSASSSDFVLVPSLSAALEAPAPAPEAAAAPATKPGSELRKIEGLGAPVLAVALSPDGAQAASATEAGLVRVHAIADGSETAKLEGHQGAVRGLAFIDASTLASAGADKVVRVFGLAEKKELRALAGHEGAITSLAIRPDRKQLATGGEDRTVRLWDPANPKELRSIGGFEGPVLSVAFSADGKEVISGAADGAVRSFTAEDGKEKASFRQSAGALAVAASPDGRYYSSGQGNDVLDWRVSSNAPVREMKGHGDIVHAVAFSPDRRTAASTSADKTVRIWSLADGKEVRSIAAHASSAYCVAFSPDGELVASGGFDKLVKVFKTADGSEVKKLEGHEEGVFCLAFIDADTILSGSSDRTIRRWSIKEGKALATLSGHPGWVSDLRLAPGKPRAVSVDYGGNLMVWDLEKGQSIFNRKLAAVVHGLALSPDFRWLATANGDSSSFLIECPPALR